MLIHELSIAIQRDRERAMQRALSARRLLAGACLERGVVARMRATLRPGHPTRHPRVPGGRQEVRPTR